METNNQIKILNISNYLNWNVKAYFTVITTPLH